MLLLSLRSCYPCLDAHVSSPPATQCKQKTGTDHLFQHDRDSVKRGKRGLSPFFLCVPVFPVSPFSLDLLDPEQRAGIVPPSRFLHSHLKVEKRRALHEEYRERTHSGIAHRVALIVAALARIRQGAQRLANRGNQRLYGPLHRRGLRLEDQGTLQ
jgi:hypothetical protein